MQHAHLVKVITAAGNLAPLCTVSMGESYWHTIPVQFWIKYFFIKNIAITQSVKLDHAGLNAQAENEWQDGRMGWRHVLIMLNIWHGLGENKLVVEVRMTCECFLVTNNCYNILFSCIYAKCITCNYTIKIPDKLPMFPLFKKRRVVKAKNMQLSS